MHLEGKLHGFGRAVAFCGEDCLTDSDRRVGAGRLPGSAGGCEFDIPANPGPGPREPSPAGRVSAHPGFGPWRFPPRLRRGFQHGCPWRSWIR